MATDFEIITVASHDDEALLDEFHTGIYWDAFPDQQEPVSRWKRALWGGASPFQLTIRIAGRRLRDARHREIVGGIAYERYPRCGCGLVTYMVVAPAARRQGLGRRMQDEAVQALYAAGAPVVFGELNDPRRAGEGASEPVADMWRRIERNQAWGARVLDIRYVQPALAPGLARNRGLCLIAMTSSQPLGPWLPGALVRDFVDELYQITEGDGADPGELAAYPDRIALVELRR